MLTFHSANVRSVNPQRAVPELLETAFGSTEPDCDLVLMNAAVGHDLAVLTEEVRRWIPKAQVLASSCAGVVGPQGPGETSHDIVMMGIRGDGLVIAHRDDLFGSTSFERGVELGQSLQQQAPQPVRMVYLLASGIDIANDRLIAGMESVLGAEEIGRAHV